MAAMLRRPHCLPRQESGKSLYSTDREGSGFGATVASSCLHCTRPHRKSIRPRDKEGLDYGAIEASPYHLFQQPPNKYFSSMDKDGSDFVATAICFRRHDCMTIRARDRGILRSKPLQHRHISSINGDHACHFIPRTRRLLNS
jgi:hypothetical protein